MRDRRLLLLAPGEALHRPGEDTGVGGEELADEPGPLAGERDILGPAVFGAFLPHHQPLGRELFDDGEDVAFASGGFNVIFALESLANVADRAGCFHQRP